jgi:superfamily II DNA or RNA helicase
MQQLSLIEARSPHPHPLQLPPAIATPSQPKEITPFEFQSRMISEVYGHIKSNIRRILIVAPTGSGKTLLASLIFRDATIRARKPIRCVFLVDLNCLISQAVKEFEALGIRCATLQGSKSRSRRAQKEISERSVIVASIQTLTSWMKTRTLKEILGEVGLFVFDEAHTTAHSKVAIALQEVYTIGTVFLGLTATPKTENRKRYLGKYFDVKVIAPPNPELIRLGRIVPGRNFTPSGVIDSEKLHINKTTGDFDESEMAGQLQSKAALRTVVKKWKEQAENRSTAAYCPRVDTAKELAATFNEEGVTAEWRDGGTPIGKDGKAEHEAGIKTRCAIDYRLTIGLTKVVCSVGTDTKGWNNSGLGCVLMVRATRIWSLFCQIVGRGSRTCDWVYWANEGRGGKKENYILIDFGGNLNRFGVSPNAIGCDPESDYDITENVRRFTESEPMLKSCPNCEAQVPIRVMICPECGQEFVKDEKEEPSEQIEFDIELSEWFDEHAIGQVGFLRERLRSGFRLNKHPDIAVKEFKKEYGFIPPRDWHHRAIFGLNPKKHDRASYYEYLQGFAPHEFWIHAHMGLEFGDGKDKPRKGKPRSATKLWWEVLGVNKGCDRVSAKRAYLELAKEWHPDKGGDRALSESAMKSLNSAWEKAAKWFEVKEAATD